MNTTPRVEKKDVSAPIASGYNPIVVEATWCATGGISFFKPRLGPGSDAKSEGLFVISAPPPNDRKPAHLQLPFRMRLYRMLRKTTLFVPGFDHAKISTQSVVEKRLFKSGRTRHLVVTSSSRPCGIGKMYRRTYHQKTL